MTHLHKHLEQAKRDYRSQRYPGDLAADILGESDAIPISRGRSMTMRIVGFSAGISAVAAAIVLWVTLKPATQTPTTPSSPLIATSWPTDETVTVAHVAEHEEVIEVQSIAEMGAVPAFPEDVSFAPQATELSIPSTFSFPSMDMDFTQDNADMDSKES